METSSKPNQRRSQRDYSLAFKLQVISEVEKGELSYKQAQRKYGIQGRSTVLVWLRKHSILDWSVHKWDHQATMNIEKTPEQKIKESHGRPRRSFTGKREGKSSYFKCSY